ncbi:MAG TPA: hypothetical protein VI488_04335 [Candidatus Angelobacter sp.]
MRSGLIFNASARITNRYLLCRMLAASARKMHRDGVSTSQCINNSLRALQDVKHPEEQPVVAPVREEAALLVGNEAALVP